LLDVVFKGTRRVPLNTSIVLLQKNYLLVRKSLNRKKKIAMVLAGKTFHVNDRKPDFEFRLSATRLQKVSYYTYYYGYYTLQSVVGNEGSS